MIIFGETQKKSLKGQAFSLDFIVSMFIFFFLIGIIFYYLFATVPTPQNDLRAKANDVTNLLAQRVGSQNALDCSDLYALETEDYSDLKASLNVNPYDFWIEFVNVNSSVCNNIANNTIGSVASPGILNIATAVRIVSVNGTQTQMSVSVYNSMS